jgi:hypothetical protein
MPWQITRSKRILTSSKVRDYSDSSISKGPKIWTLSQLQEQKRQLDERRSKAEHRRFFITLCERTRLIGPPSHVIEDGGVTDTQDEMDKTTARHATLQTTIQCVILIFLLFFFFSQFYCSTFGGSRKSYVPRSRLLRRKAAEREWAAVVPSLVDPYLEWKSTRVTSRPETQSDTIWPIPVLGIKGLYAGTHSFS